MKPKVYFKTFGCRTNLFDTQVMISNLRSFDIAASEAEADTVVINSCTVTNSADAGVRSYINQVKKRNPEAKIYFTGCAVQTQGKVLFNTGKLAGVFGHSEKEKVDQLLGTEDFFDPGVLDHVDTTLVEEFVGKSRAFIKVQEGCDFTCSYCIIPFARGKARSHDEALVLAQVRQLAERGFGEFVFTGTNVGSFGKDTGSSLARLLAESAEIPGVKRLRLGSVEPVQIDDAFLELLDEPWMARHLHIAIQHSHDAMLEKMDRRNRFAGDLALFETLAEKGYALGTDYITGFPGESGAIWKEALANLEKMPLTHLHGFSYSKRDGTPAATMKPEVAGDVARERLKEATALVKAKNLAFRKRQTVPLEVLAENDGTGLDQFFNRMTLESGTDLSGRWLKITDYEVGDETNRAAVR